MSPPRLARWLTRLAAPEDRCADMLGDLEEVHLRRRTKGALRAWLTTVFEASAIATLLARERLGPTLHLRDWLRARDVQMGFRLMRREPIVTVTATAALTVGIGLLTVGAATVETLLFSRLPFEGGERFVLIRALGEPDRRPVSLTPEAYQLMAAGATALTHVGAASQNRENVTFPSGLVDEATTAGITPTSLTFLPYVPVRGRRLTPDDATPGAAPVVMIREAFWRRAFGGAEDAVGATLDVGGIRRLIVGVMPDAFQFPSRPPDLWTPIQEAFLTGRGALPPNARLFGILAPGSTLASAQRELTAIAALLAATSRVDGPVRLEVTSITDLGPQAPVVASAIIAVVIAILIVVAANVANLVLARSFLRARELAVRTALGASRARLVGQIAVEVLVLCAVAAVIGSAAAQATLRQFNAMEDLPFWVDFTAGPGTSLLVVGATLLATIVAGVWPAFRITRGDLLPTLQSGGGGGDVRFGRAAAVMVVVQIALSIVMLHGALVFAGSLRAYAGEDLNLPRNVLTTGLRFGAGAPTTGDPRASSITREEVESIAAAVPGVIATALTTALPRHSPPAQLVEVEPMVGEARYAPGPAPSAEVSEGFFATVGAAALTGRLLMPSDYAPGAPPVAVVNIPFVQKFFRDASPLGRRFRTVDGDRPGQWHEIVGIVPDLGLSVGDPSLAAGYYLPLTPGEPRGRWIYLAMRVGGDPLAYVNPLRRALYERDPTLVLNRPERLEDVAGEDRVFFLWLSRALIALGVVTLILALTGVYAMMALIVAKRTRDIGIRMALGATASRIAAAVIGRAAWQVALGGALGAVLAILSLDLRDVLVSRVGDGGTWTLPLVLVLLVLSGLGATGVPLRKALRVEPVQAMRTE